MADAVGAVGAAAAMGTALGVVVMMGLRGATGGPVDVAPLLHVQD